MGLFRPSREPYGPDPYLYWKMLCFTLGAGFGLAAMISGIDWLIFPAVAILAVGIGLRFLRRKE
ncbi:MAG TPA: hypothetical protein VFQ38_00655 [Longimicrobiales bacterium]|nr:hypothetical protein [Longimicrobiales bacterium]